MKQRNTPLVMNSHECECGARDHMAVAQTTRNALGKVGFAHPQAAGQDQHITIFQARRDQLAKMLRIGRASRFINTYP